MSLVHLPETAVVLAETDWSALQHAYGMAEDTPAQLVGLLDDDQLVRSQALEPPASRGAPPEHPLHHDGPGRALRGRRPP